MAINKKYYEGMCKTCDCSICKVYGGTCRKYRRKEFFEKFFNLFKK